MAARRLNNYLTTYRKHAGLSQSEMSFLVRLRDKSELSRYEQGRRQPSLRTALACQAAFGTPVSELFAGLSDSVAKDTHGQMRKLSKRFREKATTGGEERNVMQKFQWVSQRLMDMPRFITSFVV
jgi:transcriptional regulator with XRE-family HTH domain